METKPQFISGKIDPYVVYQYLFFGVAVLAHF